MYFRFTSLNVSVYRYGSEKRRQTARARLKSKQRGRKILRREKRIKEIEMTEKKPIVGISCDQIEQIM